MGGRYSYEDHEDFRDQYRDCYPREQIAPPSIEITYIERDGQRLITSPILKRRDADRELNRHVLNFFLSFLAHVSWCEPILRGSLQQLSKKLTGGSFPLASILGIVLRPTLSVLLAGLVTAHER